MLIYKITNDINGKVYVGQTAFTLEKRWREHRSKTCCGSPCAIHNAMRKYGTEHFHMEQIDVAASKAELNEKERYWIKTLNTLYPNGYNLTEGGCSAGWTEFTREKLSGENHWTTRSSFSQESLQKKHDALFQKPSGRSRPVRCIETGEVCAYAKEFFYKYGYPFEKILECCKGKRTRSAGLHWEYA